MSDIIYTEKHKNIYFKIHSYETSIVIDMSDRNDSSGLRLIQTLDKHFNDFQEYQKEMQDGE